MAYFLRYIVDDERGIKLTALEDALKQIDTAYTVEHFPDADVLEVGLLNHGDDPCGDIEINHKGDELFLDERDELVADIEEVAGAGPVLTLLQNATAIIAVQPIWQGDDPAPALSKLDPLWHWLFENRSGLLQVDDEGYYDREELILAVGETT